MPGSGLMPPSSSLMPSPGGDSTLTTKGDLLSFGADGKVRLPIGADGLVLRADSTTESGLAWSADSVSQLTAKGDLLVFGTAAARLPVGSNNQVLVADDGQTYGLKWAAVPGALTGLGLDNALALWNGTGTLKHNASILSTTSGGLALTGAYAIGTTPTEAKGLVLRNSTAAADGAQQYSPSIYLAGQGWDTTPGASRELVWRLNTVPTQGTTVDGYVSFSHSIDGAAYTESAELGTYGFWMTRQYGYTQCGPAATSIGVYHESALGITGNLICSYGNARSLQIYGSMASGAGNLNATVDAGVFAASIDAAHKVLGIGWLNNAYARTELGYFTGGGGLTLSSAMAIGTTPVETKGIVLRNSTAAANGAQQYSPSIYLAGQGWETTGSSSDEVAWRITNVPVQGTAASSNLVFSASLNGAAYTDVVRVKSGGVVEHVRSGLGAGLGSSVYVVNETAATAGTQQWSPAVTFQGQGWDTGSNSSSSLYCYMHLKTTAGNDPYGTLTFTMQKADSSTVDPIYFRGDTGDTYILNNTYFSKSLITNDGTNVHIGGDATRWGDFYPTTVSAGTATHNIYLTSVSRISGGTGPGIINLGSSTTSDTLEIFGQRSSGSGNISLYLGADVNAASIDAAHKVASVGWVNNSNAYTELGYFTGGGGLTLSSAKAIGTTPVETKGLVLRNSTAAADGAQQYSPSIYLAGQGWETTGSSSDEVVWRITNVPVQGAAASSNLYFDVSLNGGAYANKWYFGSDGTLNSSASTTAIITGAEADGATAIGVKLNTSTTYSTAGAKLLSVQNNGTEKAYLTHDGLLRVASSLRAAGDYGSGEASTLTLTNATAAKDSTAATLGETPTGIAAENAAWLKVYVGTTAAYIPYWTA